MTTRNPSINERVRQLEISQELLVNEVKAVNTKQDTFYSEWKHQQDENRRQKEEDRRTADSAAKNNRITLPQLFTMGAALVTMLTGYAIYNNYNVDSRVSAQVTPLTERQNATTEANLVRNSKDAERDKIMSEIMSVQAEHNRQLEVNIKAIEGLSIMKDRVKALEVEMDAEAEIRRLQDESADRLQNTKDQSILEELRRLKEHMEKAP